MKKKLLSLFQVILRYCVVPTVLVILLGFTSYLASAVPGGDLAPRPGGDGQLTAADLIILQRFIHGELVPDDDEMLVGDVAPLGSPDEDLNAGDLILLQRAIHGLVTLPDVELEPDPIVLPGGELDTTTFEAGTYIVQGHLTVPEGEIVSINAGAVFQFQGNYALNVYGALIVEGEDGNEVVFTSGNEPKSQWTGIRLYAAGSRIDHAYIEWSRYGITVQGVQATITNSEITVFSDYGIYVTLDGSVTITNNTIYNPSNTGGGIYLNRSTATITDNTIHTTATAVILSESTGTVVNNNLSDNNNGLAISYLPYSPYFPNGSVVVQGNTIQANTQAGINITRGATPQITGNNSITENTRGIRIDGITGSNVDLNPQPVITGNQIYDNTQWNILAQNFADAANYSIDVANNWWGEVNSGLVQATIGDHEVWPTSPWVNFTPFLDGPQGNDVPGNYLRGPLDTSQPLAGVTYEVIGDLRVLEDQTWTINAGAEFIFMSDYVFNVDGALQVNGESEQEVTFRSFAGGNNDWPGINIKDLSDGSSVIDHAIIQNATTGVTVTDTSAVVSNSKINSYYTAGLKYDNAGGSIDYSIIDRNEEVIPSFTTYGIWLDASSPAIRGNTIRANDRGIYVYMQSAPVINERNIIIGNRHGLYVYGSNQEGYPAPEVTGNDIYNNVYSGNQVWNYYTTGSFYDWQNFTLTATENWWGTSDPDEILATIRDRNRPNGNGLPFVNFNPFWSGAGGGEPADDYLIGPVDTSQPLVEGAYQVIGDITVPQGQTWVIDPGAELIFMSDYTFTVNGALQVNGTNDQRVIMRSENQGTGDWPGIEITALSDGTSVIDNAIIQNAEIAITVSGTNADIRSCDIIQYSRRGIIYQDNADGTISDNLIDPQNESLNDARGITLENASPTIQGNRVQGNRMGFFINLDSSPLINERNIITGNEYGLYVTSSSVLSDVDPSPIVTGNDIYDNYNQGHEYNYYTTYFIDPSIPLHAELNWWGSTDPVEISDTIWDWNASGNAQNPLVLFTRFLDGPDGQEVPGEYLNGPVDTSQSLPPDTYLVVGNLIVPEDETWQISAGAELIFLDNHYLKVNGSIDVNGTELTPVVFRSEEDGSSYWPSSDWPGIEITSLSNGQSVIEHAIIDNALDGVKVTGTNADVTNCIITNYGGCGVLYESGADGTIRGNHIEALSGRITYSLFGIRLDDSSPSIQGNTIRGNGRGIYVFHDSDPVITNGNIITENWRGVEVSGNGQASAPEVTYNAIYDNIDEEEYSRPYNYYVVGFGDESHTILTATHNWWGSTDPGAIGTSIRDFSDDPTLPLVNFTPFLESQGGPIVSGNYFMGFVDSTQTLPQGTYEVTGDILVAEEATWTVPAGTELLFTEDYEVVVNGTLQLLGQENNEITMTSDRRGEGSRYWGGIQINGPDSTGRVEHAIIEKAAIGVKAEGSADVTVLDCIIREFSGKSGSYLFGLSLTNVQNGLLERNLIQHFIFLEESESTAPVGIIGISVNDSTNIVINNNIIKKLYNGIWVTGSDIDITNNKVSENAFGIRVKSCDPDISGNIIEENSNGIRVENSSADPYIHDNDIINNSNAIWVFGRDPILPEGYGGFYHPSPLVRRNNIYDNSRNYVVTQFDWGLSLDARENWWGTRDVMDISGGIDSADTIVEFAPFLDSPNGEVVLDNFLFGEITSDRTLAANMVYEVVGTVQVIDGATLTIEAGVTLNFHNTSLEIREGANLVVNGTLDNRVLFTSEVNEFGIFKWSTSGVHVEDAESNAIINYARFENFYQGVEVYSGHADIVNSVFDNCEMGVRFRPATYGEVCTGVVHGNQFINCRDFAVSISQYPINVTNNIFINNVNNAGEALIIGWGETSVPVSITGNIFNGYAIAVRINVNHPAGTGPQINNNDFYNGIMPNITHIYASRYLPDGVAADVLNLQGNWFEGGEVSVVQNSNDGLQVITTIDHSNQSTDPLSGPVATQVVGSPLHISPADQNGFLDSTTYSAVLSIDTSWTLSVRNASGTTVRTEPGTGTDINFTWDGKDSGDVFVPDGRYTISITTTGPSGSIDSGHLAVNVDNTLPVADLDNTLDGTTLAALSTIPLRGTATDANFQEYRLEISESATPDQWTEVLVSPESITNSNLYIWPINGFDGNTPVADGTYTLRLTVTDTCGNENSDSVQIAIANLRILNVSVDQQVFRPTDGAPAVFSFDMNMPADVTLEISPEYDEDNILWQSTISAVAGNNSISWDGIGLSGNLVDNEAYGYKLYATDGTREALYDPGRYDSTGQVTEIDTLESYAPFINDYWKCTVSLTGPTRVGLDIYAKFSDVLPDYFTHVFQEAGEHTFYWDFRDANGKPSYGPANGLYGTAIDFKPLKINSIFVEGVNPIIRGTGEAPNIEVKSDPYLVHFSYDQLTSLAYTIDMDSHVTVKILPPGRTDLQTDDVVTVVENVLQSAEDNGEPLIQHVTWDGRDIDDIGTNRIGISDEGTFSFVIEATGVVSQMTTTYWGYVNLYK